MLTSVKDFLRLEAAGGIILILTAVLALLVKNSPLDVFYDMFLGLPVEIRVGNFEIAKPLLLWINDGLMAIFFFLVGLEIKREILEGELSEPDKVILPAIAAVGGMSCPALIYYFFNHSDPVALQGWAIPAATDIAFALGILALLGDRVPAALKLFLLGVAIVDDIGAVIIIALFYTDNLSITSLVIGAACLAILYTFNRRGIEETAPYIITGLILWVALLKSGVHATLAGLLLAFFIPLRGADGYSPLKHIEHDLHPAVAFFILPVFAFANVGIPLDGLELSSLLDPVPLGIALGLFLGNQAGVFGLASLTILTGICRMPTGVTWRSLYGVSCLCGVGFTMSLFISSLAFEMIGTDSAMNDRLGILMGSSLSAIWGFLVLYLVLPEDNQSESAIGEPS